MSYSFLAQIYQNKREFNLKILKLRDKKKYIIRQVEKKLKQLKEIQSQLGPNNSVALIEPPKLSIEEEPER